MHPHVLNTSAAGGDRSTAKGYSAVQGVLFRHTLQIAEGLCCAASSWQHQEQSTEQQALAATTQPQRSKAG
jgi:uncharacterized membrane protein